jgi:hypothetical protein
MTLQNLLAIQSLMEFSAQREDIQRLLAAAERNLQDSGGAGISDENRFDMAYHQTAIQTLGLTVALDAKTVVILDELRKQRNINDYEGDPIPPSVVEECQRQARLLMEQVRAWLKDNRPDFC